MIMSETVYRLPEGFKKNVGDSYIHHYRANKNSVRNRVIFSHHLICFQLSGCKDVHNQKQHITIDHSSLLLLNAGGVLMSETLSHKKEYETLLFFYSNDFLSNFCIRHRIHPNFDETAQKLIIIKKDEFLHAFGDTVLLLKNNRNSEALDAIKTEEILLYLYEQHTKLMSGFFHLALEANSELKVAEIIHSPNATGMSVEEMAFLCNMSVSTFKRHFQSIYQTSPGRYINGLRMQRAQQLLMMNRRASEIFEELGYESQSSFSHEFKKHFGYPPSKSGTTE